MSDHGADHALAVAMNGLDLAMETPGADVAVVIAFAILHDSERRNEYEDPEHPALAAEHAWDAPGLDRSQRTKLYLAIRDHAEGVVSTDPTTGCCWDADRLELPRVGIEVKARFLSTAAAKARLDLSPGSR